MQTIRETIIETHYTEMAPGSVLICCGRTKVIITASVEDGVPPFLRGKGQGWLTAEYAMLPGATPKRKQRDGLKKDGRSVEISRLIGRSLRACVDLGRLGERTVTLDCDVIQADGGTRTASITGAFVALCLAVDKLMGEGKLIDSPIIKQLAATSVGVVGGVPTLDLDYERDSQADVDMNVVMVKDKRGQLELVEVQGTGEHTSFARSALNALLDLAESGIQTLMDKQVNALGEASQVIMKKPRLVLATGSFGKLKEMRVLLGDRFDVVTMKELGLDPDIDENGETFEQNALIKAEALLALTGCATLADDSGLEVDALNGRPGVHSARYCGVHGDDEANNDKLLKELEHAKVPRTARFVSAIALLRPGQEPIVTRGECEGEITCERRGTGGFGYDPLFLSSDLGVTFGEANQLEKTKVSHRARAIEKLMQRIQDDA